MVKSHCPISLGILRIQLFHLRLDMTAPCPQTQQWHLSAITEVRGLHSEYSGAALATSAKITRVPGPACSLTTGSVLLLSVYMNKYMHVSFCFAKSPCFPLWQQITRCVLQADQMISPYIFRCSNGSLRSCSLSISPEFQGRVFFLS